MKRECKHNHPPPSEEELVETVDGPIAELREDARTQGLYPDGCPADWHGYYALEVRGIFIENTSSPHISRMLRDIALTLNAAHEHGIAVGQLNTQGET